ncbi:MAG TPA: hypothetical protein VM713_01020, partial [Steroidobacteraceae bacterium]|nr:hypothetical protein [Steroidobacteraceae bacterium]
MASPAPRLQLRALGLRVSGRLASRRAAPRVPEQPVLRLPAVGVQWPAAGARRRRRALGLALE